MSKNKKPFIAESSEKKINLIQVQFLVSDLEGKILTVIDASITEQKQREAIKSLIKQYIWGDFDKIAEWFYKQSEGNAYNFPFGYAHMAPEVKEI